MTGKGIIKYSDKYGSASFINCTCNYEDNESYNADKILEIVADDGAIFDGVFTWRGWFSSSNSLQFNFINKGNKLVADVEDWHKKTGDGKYIYWDMSGGFISINENYVAIKETVETNSFVNIYNITTDELNELGKARYVNKDNETIDYGTYISNLYTFPFKIPNDMMVSDKTDIILGNYKVDVLSTLLTNNLLTIDMGTIYTPPKYNNVYDYINTMCIAHIPFFDNIFLETEYVIDQTISIEYVIDLYVGNCTVNIYSSFIDSIIESRTTTITNNIPFIQNDNNMVIGTITSNNKNNINKAFIEIKRNRPYTKVDNILGSGVVEYGKIADYQGYIQCNKLVLETNATNQEQEEIKNILGNGVFI